MPGQNGLEATGETDIVVFGGSCPSANCFATLSPDEPLTCDIGIGGAAGPAVVTQTFSFSYNGLIIPSNSTLPGLPTPTGLFGLAGNVQP